MGIHKNRNRKEFRSRMAYTREQYAKQKAENYKYDNLHNQRAKDEDNTPDEGCSAKQKAENYKYDNLHNQRAKDEDNTPHARCGAQIVS